MTPKPKLRISDLADASEAELAELARAGNEVAVRELVRRLNPRLFRVARGMLDSDAEAEEVVQEAYLAAFTRIGEFRGDARFSTWVTRILLNAAGMRKRSARPTQEYDTVAEDDANAGTVVAFPGRGVEGPEVETGRLQIRGLLENAIAELPAALRLIFLLREAEGMSILAIARDLSLNPITVKTRLFRARRRLRIALETRLNGGFESVFPFDGARCVHMADRVVTALKSTGRLG